MLQLLLGLISSYYGENNKRFWKVIRLWLSYPYMVWGVCRTHIHTSFYLYYYYWKLLKADTNLNFEFHFVSFIMLVVCSWTLLDIVTDLDSSVNSTQTYHYLHICNKVICMLALTSPKYRTPSKVSLLQTSNK